MEQSVCSSLTCVTLAGRCINVSREGWYLSLGRMSATGRETCLHQTVYSRETKETGFVLLKYIVVIIIIIITIVPYMVAMAIMLLLTSFSFYQHSFYICSMKPLCHSLRHNFFILIFFSFLLLKFIVELFKCIEDCKSMYGCESIFTSLLPAFILVNILPSFRPLIGHSEDLLFNSYENFLGLLNVCF